MWNDYQQNYQRNYQNFNRTEVIRVNGENGANAFRMPPNSSILLLDESAPLVWLKVTDGAGYPTITPYTITPYTPAPPIDVDALAQRITRLEERMNESHDATVKRNRKEKEPEPSTDSAG